MRRITGSWQGLLAVLLLSVVLLGVLAVDVRDKQRTKALQDTVRAASLITELAVEAQLPDGDYHELHPDDLAGIERAVRHLQEEGQLVGLNLWDHDGHLLYSDLDDVPPLSAEKRAAVQDVFAGRPFVELAHEPGRAVPTVTVLLEPEDALNGPSEALAEVLLAEDAALGALAASTQRLYAVLALVLAAITLALVVLRARVRRRDHDATHDPLTGLGNRALLHRSGAAALRTARTRSDTGVVALLLLDLDGFKTVNDTLGHALGDRLLEQVAQTLRTSVRPYDVVTRLGGDEFAVLLVDLPDAETATRVAAHLHAALHRPYVVNAVSLEVGGSLGVAVAGGPDDDVDLLLRRADVAMYQAKRAGGGVRLYDPADDPHDEAQLGLLAQLRGAIDEGQLRLHYQPRVSLREGTTVGFEALVRWQHPEHGLLPPVAFIPLAERTALMRPLTAWVLREAVRQVAVWRSAGWDVSVAVNVPPRALLDDDLCAQVVQVLADHDLPGEALELEITETAVMVDPVRAAQTLRELKAVDVGVAIDDFGAGYTSLSYLKTLPVRSLKIDRGFVTDLVSSPHDEAVARSVVALGHDLGLTVVAEGVETGEVEQRLRELGCDEVQGYLLAKPMGGDDVDPWLYARTVAPRVPAQRRPADRPATTTSA